jgi:hypothetical protein
MEVALREALLRLLRLLRVALLSLGSLPLRS